jgi:hypothetical protein
LVFEIFIRSRDMPRKSQEREFVEEVDDVGDVGEAKEAPKEEIEEIKEVEESQEATREVKVGSPKKEKAGENEMKSSGQYYRDYQKRAYPDKVGLCSH